MPYTVYGYVDCSDGEIVYVGCTMHHPSTRLRQSRGNGYALVYSLKQKRGWKRAVSAYSKRDRTLTNGQHRDMIMALCVSGLIKIDIITIGTFESPEEASKCERDNIRNLQPICNSTRTGSYYACIAIPNAEYRKEYPIPT